MSKERSEQLPGLPTRRATAVPEHWPHGQRAPLGSGEDSGRSALGSGNRGSDTELPESRPAELGDPLYRSLAVPLPLAATASAVEQPAATPTAVALDRVAADILRRLSVSARGSSGTARLEFGGGPLAGACLLIECDGDELSIDLAAPPDSDATELGRKLEQRLRNKGLKIASFEIS